MANDILRVAETGGFPVASDLNAAGAVRQAIKLDGGVSGVDIPFLAGQQTPANSFPVVLSNALISEKHDDLQLLYTGTNLTSVIARTGGSGGTIVATLTLTYTGSRLDRVTKT